MARWWLIGGGAALGALLIASIALALTNRPADFAPGTPEAAVQALLRAAAADDFEAAYGLLASELRADCSLPQFAATHEGYGYSYSHDIQARLDNARIVDDAAFIVVKITEYYGGGIYGSGESSRGESYSLRRENGDWKFTTYPYPYNYCNPKAPSPPSPLPTPIPTSTPIPVQ